MTNFKKEENVTTQQGGEESVLEGPGNPGKYLFTQELFWFGGGRDGHENGRTQRRWRNMTPGMSDLLKMPGHFTGRY